MTDAPKKDIAASVRANNSIIAGKSLVSGLAKR